MLRVLKAVQLLNDRNEPGDLYSRFMNIDFGAKVLGPEIKRVYPYFSEKPVLPPEGVRLGFWAIAEALREFRVEDLRIIDVLRSSYFRSTESPMQGNERKIFIEKYDAVLTEWRKLRDAL
jgi:hypothetical protein